MIERVNGLVSQCETKENYLVRLIENAMKEMSKLKEEINSLTNSIKVESIILKEPIDNKNGVNNE